MVVMNLKFTLLTFSDLDLMIQLTFPFNLAIRKSLESSYQGTMLDVTMLKKRRVVLYSQPNEQNDDEETNKGVVLSCYGVSYWERYHQTILILKLSGETKGERGCDDDMISLRSEVMR